MTIFLKIMTSTQKFILYTSLFSAIMFKSITLGSVPVIPPPPPVFITITVTYEAPNEVHLLWKSSAFSRNVLGTCTLHYGSIYAANKTAMRFNPEENHLVVKNLKPNVTYRGFITCQNGRFILPSDTVQFTPKGNEKHTIFHPNESSKFSGNFPHSQHKLMEPNSETIKSSQSHITNHNSKTSGTQQSYPTSHESRMQDDSDAFDGTPKLGTSRHFGASAYSSVQDSNEGILVIMSQRHMDGSRIDPHNSKPSTSVILGVICGVVGFIIINVTVVMAVRQYSLRRDRQRRLFELQLEQHGGFIYNIEDILNA